MVTSNLITLHRVSVAEANKLHDCLPQKPYRDLFLSHTGDCRMLEDNAQLKKALVQTKSRLVCDAILGLAGVKSLPGVGVEGVGRQGYRVFAETLCKVVP